MDVLYWLRISAFDVVDFVHRRFDGLHLHLYVCMLYFFE